MENPAKTRREQVLEYLRQEFDADHMQLAELLFALVLNLQEITDTSRRALNTGQWEELARAGHSLKGVGANINQDDLRLTGVALEEAATAKDRDKVLLLLAKLDAVLTDLGAH